MHHRHSPLASLLRLVPSATGPDDPLIGGATAARISQSFADLRDTWHRQDLARCHAAFRAVLQQADLGLTNTALIDAALRQMAVPAADQRRWIGKLWQALGTLDIDGHGTGLQYLVDADGAHGCWYYHSYRDATRPPLAA